MEEFKTPGAARRRHREEFRQREDSLEREERREEILGNEFRNVRLPTFWRNRPKLWFTQLEGAFLSHRVRSDDTRYGAVIRHLDQETMIAIEDVLDDLPLIGKYEAVKNALITRFSDSLEKQLRTLLSDIDLGDRTPSALLREMRTLAGANVTDELLRTLWLQRLPQRIQELLAVLEGVELKSLAACADKALERSGGNAVSAVARTPQSDFERRMEERMEKLTAQINALQLHRDDRSRRGQSSARRQRSRSRNRRRQETEGPTGYCHYHRRFKEKAWRCLQPCQAPYPLAPPPENFGNRRQ